MKKIKTEDVTKYIGEYIEESIYFKGFPLVEAKTLITKELAYRLFPLAEEIPIISISSESTPDTNNLNSSQLSKFTIDDLYDKVKILMRNYSFDNLEDSELVTEIIESTIANLTAKTDLGIDIDYLLLNEPDLYAHTINTTVLATLLAIKASVFQKWMIQQIALGALLHDIGYTPILLQNEVHKITELPFEERLRHPVVGYELLENNEFIAQGVKKIVLMHHIWNHPEKSLDEGANINLSYPKEYKGKAIPKEAKTLPISIVQVASEFEQMINTSNPNSISKKAAIDRIIKGAENIYGEGALLLANYISPYGVGDQVKLNNGKSAVIEKITSTPSRPIIKCEDVKIDLRLKPFIRIVD